MPYGYTIEEKTTYTWLYAADFVRKFDNGLSLWIETDEKRPVLAYRPDQVSEQKIVELATADALSRTFHANPNGRTTALRRFANLMADLGAYDRGDRRNQRRKAA